MYDKLRPSNQPTCHDELFILSIIDGIDFTRTYSSIKIINIGTTSLCC